jgi:DNA (cytosine-5)-methyltransferase 1
MHVDGHPCMMMRRESERGHDFGGRCLRKVISLYTGAGGLDLGLEAAGFETRVAVEMDSDAVATLRQNRDWPVIDRDIHEVASGEILSAAELDAGEADLLIGGPPCQPFSKSAFWARGDTKRLDDPRASTLEQYLRVLRDTQPRAFLLENVPGLGYRNKSEGLDLLLRIVETVNREKGTDYQPAFAVLNAAEFGVPQDRKRLFLVAARDGTRFEFPEATHTVAGREAAQLQLGGGEPVRTVWDAIGDLDGEADDDPALRMTGKWADLLPSIPEGENYLYHTPRGDGLPLFGWRRRYWSFLLKLAKRLPSWTITAQPGSAIGPFHWKNRRLSTRELCRLQTFPDGYRVVGGRASAQKQLGNAVASALAERLGIEIRSQLFGDFDAGRPEPTLLPPRRKSIPPPEPVSAVPESYHHLIGDHADHPGTGQGAGALARQSGS